MNPLFYLRKLPLTLGTFALFAGFSHLDANAQNINPSNTQTTEVDQYNPWAQDVLKTLATDRLEAVLTEANGHKIVALDLWKNAFRKVLAHRQYPETQSSLIYRIAERTLQLAESLKDQREGANCPDDDQVCLDRSYLPIFDVYNHGYQMIQDFSSFDQSYYHELITCFKTPTASVAKEMEKQLRDYAVAQIHWFKTNFRVSNGDGFSAKYSNHMYYVVLDALLKGLIADLGNDFTNEQDQPLFSTSYAEAVDQMRSLAQKLDNQIVGNSLYGPEPGAFWFYNILLTQIDSSLSGGKL